VIRLRFVALSLPLAFGTLAAFAVVQAQNASAGYSYLKNRPLPKTPAERDSECAWIRLEVARIRSQAELGASTAAQFNSPALAQSIEAAARRDIPQLEDRYGQIQCDLVPAAPTQRVVVPSPAQFASAQAAAAPSSQAVAAPSPAAVAPSQPVYQSSKAIVEPSPAVPSSAVVAPSPAVAAPSQPVYQSSKAIVEPSPAVAAPLQPCAGLTFDQCFAKCRELTDRTKAQCFDACRH